MRNETLAIHGGYDGDPTTKAVAVPIYQTAAYEFDSAEHGAALFNLEAPGFRYTRINNPTVDVLDRHDTVFYQLAHFSGARPGLPLQSALPGLSSVRHVLASAYA